MPVTDRYGLPLTTSSPAAAEHYQRGMDLLLSYGRGTGEAFDAALAADEGLAVAQAGRALLPPLPGGRRPRAHSRGAGGGAGGGPQPARAPARGGRVGAGRRRY